MISSDSSSYDNVFYIKEQDLSLVNEVKPYFKKYGDLYVIIAREYNIHNGYNNGNLRVGIIKYKNENVELVLPFCTSLIYATIDNGIVTLTYVEDKSLKTKEIPLNEEEKLDFEDYSFLLGNEKADLKPVR